MKKILETAAALLLVFTSVVHTQNLPPRSSSVIPDGRKVYAEYCASCHGADAGGTARARRLAGNRSLRSRSREEISDVIQHGIPASGMPAFNLPHSQIEALANFVHSLNSAAAETFVSGDPLPGQQFFFGKAQCSSCHMIHGRGSLIGPDLSNTGREMTVHEIQRVLSNPDGHITPGYELVTVHLRNGQKVRGFARGRSNFDIRLQDLNGNFHLLHSDEISSIQDEKQSLMRPLEASAEQSQNLIAYLSHLTGVAPGALDPATINPNPNAPGISFLKILNPNPGDWPTYNGRLTGNRYSDLDQINTGNVSKLTPKWIFPMDHFGLETTPIVASGVMYVTGPNQAYALDALTGRPIWEYSRSRTQGLVGDASLGTNRGLALLGDKVFMVTDNAHLIALNRITGSLVWDVVMPETPQHYGSTISPLIVKDTVIAGVSGGDWGIRGFIACFKAATGELVWRHWTIPSKGEPGYDTWKGTDPQFGGGSTWLTGSYDAETDTLYWPTGNPWPDSDDRNRPGDNLFTDCILALKPDTGALKWHYQFTPHDVRDRDATETPVLIDTEYAGQQRRLLLHADRNGFFYVLDRTNGKLLLAKKFLRRVNWANGIGPDGRPQLPPPSKDSNTPDAGCPGDATNWSAPAYSPVTRLYYFMTLEECQSGDSLGVLKGFDRPEEAGQKYMRAVSIDTGEIVWEIPQIGPVFAKNWPGVLATAGGIVVFGDPNGALVAVNDQAGRALWHFSTNVHMKASPMTYMTNGKQFIAIAAGSNILCFGLGS